MARQRHHQSAKETQGVLVTGGGGTEELGFVRFAMAESGGKSLLPVYEKSFGRDALGGMDVGNGIQHNQGGFRMIGRRRHRIFYVSRQLLSGHTSETLRAPSPAPPTFAQILQHEINYSGGNLLTADARLGG